MLEKIIEQYKKVNGIKNFNINDLKDENNRKEFLFWINERQKYGYRYLDFLYEINQNIFDRTTAEVGKTELDSLVLPFDTTIISPYDFNKIEDQNRLIKSKLIIHNETPMLYYNRANQSGFIELSNRRINTLIIHNPYDKLPVKKWALVHDNGVFDIAVGVYGDINDKNLKENLKLLKNLKDQILNDDFKFDYNTDGNIYYAAVASTRKEKKLGSKTR